MIDKNNFNLVLSALNFKIKNEIYSKTINGYELKVDFKNKKLIYPECLKHHRDTTLNFSQNENFVVFECIHALLQAGYKPNQIELEKPMPGGHHDTGGFCDILVQDNYGKPYLLIECKTTDSKNSELDRAWKKMQKDGGQLFNYFNTYHQAEFLCIYASDFNNNKLEQNYYLISLKDNEEYLKSNTGFTSFAQVKENNLGKEAYFNVWKNTYQQDYLQVGLFESKPFDICTIPFPTPKNPQFTFIDLFAGIGGFRLAMQNLGGKCIFSSEWDKNAQITYYKNFGDIPFGDITKKETKQYIPNEFDILCAGFPCQAFSIAGYQKGFLDTRGTLFFDIEQIAKKHKPKVIFLENVKNLVAHDKGNTFKVILNTLEKKLGYKIFYKVLNSMEYANIPQNRERIFIIAFNPKKVKSYKKFTFPKEIKLTKTIHDFLEKNKQDNKYYYSEKHQYYPELVKIITKKNTVYQWRRIYVRENKNSVCPTLTANMGTGGHNVPIIKDDFGIRKLTPKECFAFQGYPMNKYILPSIANSKLYMQAGNSVTMPLIERIGNEIIKVLSL